MTIKAFTVYDNTGKILRSGQVPEEVFAAQASTNEFIIEEDSDPENDIVDVNTLTVIKGGKPALPIDMDYVKARAQAYPPITHQLDMLWYAMDTDQIPKAEPFYSTLKAVKLAYPSDSSVIPGSVDIFTMRP